MDQNQIQVSTTFQTMPHYMDTILEIFWSHSLIFLHPPTILSLHFGRLSCFSGHLSGPELVSNALMLRFLLALLWGTSLLLFQYPLRPRKQRPRDLHKGRSSAEEGWCWLLCNTTATARAPGTVWPTPSEDSCRSCCSPSTMWVLGIELRPSGLVTGAFTLWATSLAPTL